MKKINFKIVLPLLLFLLLFFYTAHLRGKVIEFESPINPVGTYQRFPFNKEKDPLEIIVITQEDEVYAYNQFEPLTKTPLIKYEENIYGFQWNGIKFLKIEKDHLFYLDSEKDIVYGLKKVDKVPSFINIKREDFE